MPSGLILAAGAGTRFAASGGAIKQLAQFRGKPLLQWAIDAHCAVAELGRVVVVLGAHAEEIAAGVSFGRAEPVICLDWRHGQSASLQAGMAALSGAEPVLVTLGDQPLISAELLARCLQSAPGTRASYAGRPGHPVLLGAEHAAAIGGLGGDRGARGLLADAALLECRELTDALDADSDVDVIDDLERLGG